MKILLTGANGMLGTDITKRLQALGIEYQGIDIETLDITNEKAVNGFIAHYKPTAVIHCAAYTAVDKAEEEPKLCMAINATGTENIAKACQRINASLLYISTDYVFNGSGNSPHETTTPTAPLSIYGKSKLAGENAVTQYIEKHFIVRVSWLFGQNGNNFVKTMQRLGETKNKINVVSDQIGSPTYTTDLAVLLCDIIQSDKYGTYHATNEGFCSWATFAQEIMRINNCACTITPISTDQYPTAARRPLNSRLSKNALDENGFNRLPVWEDALTRYIKERGN